MSPQVLDAMAFAACLAGAALPLLLLIRKQRRPSFSDFVEPFNRAEEDAKARGNTRAIGKARRERREAVHASLRRAA